MIQSIVLKLKGSNCILVIVESSIQLRNLIAEFLGFFSLVGILVQLFELVILFFDFVIEFFEIFVKQLLQLFLNIRNVGR